MNCLRCAAPVALLPGSAFAECPYCHTAVEPNPGEIAGPYSPSAPSASFAGPPLASPDFRSAPTLDLSGIPNAPRVPSQRARDLVFAYTGSQAVMRLIGFIFLLVGIVPASILGWGLPIDVALAVAGTPTTATVIGTSVQTNVRVNGRHPTLIHYRFKADGASYEGTSPTLDAALLTSAARGAGGTVPVEFLAASPSFSRVSGATYSQFGYWSMFTLIFPVVGGGLLASAIRSNRREIRAFTTGVPCVARVVFQGPDMTTRVNGRHPFKIAWEFDANGGRYSGSITNMDRSALAGLAADQAIAVLYDPAQPAVNTIWVS